MHLAGTGPDHTPENLIRTPEDVARHFFACEVLEPVGGASFHDNGKRYLVWPEEPMEPYTFGAVFLKRR